MGGGERSGWGAGRVGRREEEAPLPNAVCPRITVLGHNILCGVVVRIPYSKLVFCQAVADGVFGMASL